MNALQNVPLSVVMSIGSVLLIVSIFASKASSRFGVPSLLLFFVVGMFFGSDGLGIPFSNAHAAQVIGTVALCIILFSGGFETSFREIRPVLVQGVVLATGGLVTALLTGGFIWLISGLVHGWGLIGIRLSLLESLLLVIARSEATKQSSTQMRLSGLLRA